MYIQWKRALPREGFECIYNGQEPSQEKVLSVYTMDKSPPKRRFRVYIQWKRGQGRSWGGVCPYIYIYIYIYITLIKIVYKDALQASLSSARLLDRLEQHPRVLDALENVIHFLRLSKTCSYFGGLQNYHYYCGGAP